MRIPILTLVAAGIVAGCILFSSNVEKVKASEDLDFKALASDVVLSKAETMELVETETEAEAKVVEDKDEIVEKYVSPYDFNELRDVNEDIVSWINIPGTKVDYPVVFSKDKDYTHQNLKNEYSYSGSIFIDSNALNPLKDPINIIYGHHMKNGSMFSDIDNYTDDSFMETYSEIFLCLEDEEIKLHPVVTIIGPADGTIINVRNREDLISFSKDKTIASGSLPDNFTELYVFVTCNYSGNDFRTYLICTK